MNAEMAQPIVILVRTDPHGGRSPANGENLFLI
jgi:hypothetical protein